MPKLLSVDAFGPGVGGASGIRKPNVFKIETWHAGESGKGFLTISLTPASCFMHIVIRVALLYAAARFYSRLGTIWIKGYRLSASA